MAALSIYSFDLGKFVANQNVRVLWYVDPVGKAGPINPILVAAVGKAKMLTFKFKNFVRL